MADKPCFKVTKNKNNTLLWVSDWTILIVLVHDMQRNVLRRINTSRLDDFTNTLTSAWDNFTNNFSIGRDDTDVFNGNRYDVLVIYILLLGC